MKDELSKSAFTMALLANILWASSFVGSKYTLLSWGPYTAVFLRFILSFVVLFVAYKMFGISVVAPQTKRQWSIVALVGVILGALYPLQLSGLAYVSTGVSAAIMLLAPLILIVLAPFINGERIELQKILAIALGIVGGLILLYKNLYFSKDIEIGTWFTLGAAACLALFTLINRKFSSSVNHSTMTLYSFGIGAVAIAPFAFFEVPRIIATPPEFLKSLYALIYLVIVCTTIPFFIWNRATAMSETKNLASTMHAKTPVAIILGVLIFGETLTWHLIVGTLIVSFALWLSQSQNILNKSFMKGAKSNEREPIGSAALRRIT